MGGCGVRIKSVNASQKEGQKPRWYINFEDGSAAVCFSSQAAELQAGDLPSGWALEPPKQEGWLPVLKTPKTSGSGAYRGGKSDDERRDIRRQVALKAAVELASADSSVDSILDVAGLFNEWLNQGFSPPREKAGGGRSEGSAPTPAPSPPHARPVSQAEGSASVEPAVGGGSRSGKAAPAPAEPDCAKEEASSPKHKFVIRKGTRTGWYVCALCGKAAKEAELEVVS